MEELNNFDLVKLSNCEPRKYDLVFDLNGQKKKFTASVYMTEPFFGLHFPNELVFILRDYRTDAQQLVRAIKSLHDGEKIDLPISLLVEKNVPELQTA